MKKVIIAIALVAFSGMFFASCRSKEKCAAYGSSNTPTHKTHSY
jgi:hypothetical protein